MEPQSVTSPSTTIRNVEGMRVGFGHHRCYVCRETKTAELMARTDGPHPKVCLDCWYGA